MTALVRDRRSRPSRSSRDQPSASSGGAVCPLLHCSKKSIRQEFCPGPIRLWICESKSRQAWDLRPENSFPGAHSAGISADTAKQRWADLLWRRSIEPSPPISSSNGWESRSPATTGWPPGRTRRLVPPSRKPDKGPDPAERPYTAFRSQETVLTPFLTMTPFLTRTGKSLRGSRTSGSKNCGGV